MSHLITEYIDQNQKLHTFLEQYKNKLEQADTSFAEFSSMLAENKYNVAMGLVFTQLLQCLDENKNFSSFQLTEISALYESLIDLQMNNLDNYVEAGHFEYAVMDNLAKAQNIVSKGLQVASYKTEELKLLLEKIEQDIQLQSTK